MYHDVALLTLSPGIKRLLIWLGLHGQIKVKLKLEKYCSSPSNCFLPPRTQRSASSLPICRTHTKKAAITIILSGSNQKPTRDANSEGERRSSSLSAPLTSLSFLCVFPERRQVEEGPACSVRKKETSILISCLGRILSPSASRLSVDLAGSGVGRTHTHWYLMFSLFFLFLHSTWQGHAANYCGKETHILRGLWDVCMNWVIESATMEWRKVFGKETVLFLDLKCHLATLRAFILLSS